jgi:hypothetical protein
MPDHLSIEVVGIVHGSADGTVAVLLLGFIAIGTLCRPPLSVRRAVSRILRGRPPGRLVEPKGRRQRNPRCKPCRSPEPEPAILR